MKSLFRGYYQPNEEEFAELWANCIFVFDTNALLNLYRYPQKTREIFINILQTLTGRIWIPFQVAYEYHQHLNSVLYIQDNSYASFQRTVTDYMDELSEKIEIKAKQSNYPNNTIEKLLSILIQSKKSIIKELHSLDYERPNLEKVKEEINQIIGDKVGRCYSQDQLEKIYEQGKKRYQFKIPPGFSNYEYKKNRTSFYNEVVFKDEYNDLVKWLQIIEKAKDKETLAVILISDSSKEDWIYSAKGRNMGIRPELINEFFIETDKKPIYMYNSEQFMVYAQEYFFTHNDDNIEEAIMDIQSTKLGIEKQFEELIRLQSNFVNKNQ